MDRAERSGLGVALILHLMLFGALSLNLLKAPALPRLETTPIEVTLSDEVAPVSTAPALAPSPAPPSPQLLIEPVQPPAPAPMQQPDPQPLLTPSKLVPQPKPVARPSVKLAGKPAPAKPRAQPAPAQRRPGLSRDLVAGLRDTPSRNTTTRSSTGAPAQAVSAAIASSIGAEIRRQLKPHWKSPTGADVELLRTTLSVKLNRDGSLEGSPQLVSQAGINDSNRAQARLHVDQAIKAVRLAAPFKLPVEFYDAWREIRPSFDRRLSQ